MSLYTERLRKLREEQEENYRSPFAEDHLCTKDRNEVITLILTDMYSVEDFNKIKTELLKLNGIIDVNRRLTKKLEITYDYTKIGVHQIVLTLDKTGYNYIKKY